MGRWNLTAKQVQEFKETEIGKIPVDWEVKRLEMLFHISAGGDLSKISFSKDKSNEYKYPVYSNSLNNKGIEELFKELEYDEIQKKTTTIKEDEKVSYQKWWQRMLPIIHDLYAHGRTGS